MKGKLLTLIVLIVMFTILTEGKFGLISKLTKLSCQNRVNQLQNVINVMCNNIANGTNNTLRDACKGCFRTAITASNNQPSLAQMQNCATMYLTNTNYSRCITSIQGAAANEINPLKGKCKTGYCSFVRCIRSVNADVLISKCTAAALLMMPSTIPDRRVNLYKNITSCILAMSRCLTTNPITGETQSNQVVYSKLGKPCSTGRKSTALQITPSGELRVIAFSQTLSVGQYFCSNSNGLSQSSWNGLTC